MIITPESPTEILQAIAEAEMEGVKDCLTGEVPPREALRHVAQHLYDDVAESPGSTCNGKMRVVADWLQAVAERER